MVNLGHAIIELGFLDGLTGPLDDAQVPIFVDLTSLPLEAVEEVAPAVRTVHRVGPRVASLEAGARCTILV